MPCAGTLADFNLVTVTLWRPQSPFCDPLRSNTTALHVVIQEAIGYDVLSYELQAHAHRPAQPPPPP